MIHGGTNGLSRAQRRAQARIEARAAKRRRKTIAVASAASMLATGVSTMLTASPASADPTTHVVTSNGDSGAGTLRQAIADSAAGDIITFDPSVTTITTASQLVVDKPLSIEGPGHASLTITSTGNHRIFYLGNGSTVDDVLLQGMTISGATFSSGLGGGAAVYSFDNLTLDDVTVSGNTGNTGVIDQSGGTLIIQDSHITGNTATSFGTVMSVAVPDGAFDQISGTEIDHNSAKYGALAFSAPSLGGGTSIQTNPSASAILFESNLHDNTASAGHYASSFSGAGAVSVTPSGGALDLTVSESTIADNDGGYAGPGGLLVDGGGSQVNMFDTTVSGNTSENEGGGVVVYGNANGDSGNPYSPTAALNAFDSTFSNNTSSSGGGAIFVGGEGSTKAGDVTLNDCTVSGNSASNGGGGLYGGGYGTVGLQSSDVVDNYAGHDGGGVYLRFFGFSYNSVIAGNNSHGGQGKDVDLSGAGFVAKSSLVQSPIYGSLYPSSEGNILGQDPMLGVLADNGGPTLTHLPQDGSPLIDAGDSSLTDQPGDQRGFTPRVVGGGLDIGSVEVGATLYVPPPPPPPDDTTTTPAGTGGPQPTQQQDDTSTLPPPDSSGDSSTTVQTSQGSVTVTVLGGDTDGGTVEVKTESTDQLKQDEVTNGFTLLGTSFEVSVTDTTFSHVQVCFPYTDAALADAGIAASDVQLFHFKDDGTREVVPTTVDTSTHQICGTVDSLSPFALGKLATTRLAGTTAPATAAAMSAATFDPGVKVAYLVTSAGFADALGAGPAAASAGAPVLLVSKDSVPDATAEELHRLQPGKIVVIGGTGVISDGVLAQAQAIAPTTRVSGADRYATAAALSSQTFSPGVAVAYVVTGSGFADGLVAGAAAAQSGGPVLLANGDTLPQATKDELTRLAPKKIVVVGGTAGVSDGVESQLNAIAPTSRLAGADRYATAAAVARTFPAGSSVIAATGTGAADALAGVPVAAVEHAALVLVAPTSVPSSVSSALDAIGPQAITVLGGTAAISLQTEVDLAAHLPEK